MWNDRWPAVPRDIATATYDAVTSATEHSREQFDAALVELGKLPFDQVASVHFRIVRELMERLHPDGLSGGDVSDTLANCARDAAQWWPSVNVQFLAVVLTGALGVGEVDETYRGQNRAEIVEAAALIIADLVAVMQISSVECIAQAVEEIARSETIEVP